MARYFFQSTSSAHSEITALYDFVWPTAAAIWNLRWQVVGYLKEYEKADEADIQARFVRGSKIHGANIRRTCTELTWEDQQQRLALILLTNFFAIYEGWLNLTVAALGIQGKDHREFVDKLQFPTRNSRTNGITNAITSLTASKSRMITQAFYPVLTANKKYSGTNLENLLLCYRFFKETRNCVIHNNGIADTKCINAYREFSSVATPSGLGLSEVPYHTAPTIGTKTELRLRGVVGFGEVIHRMLVTLDAELSRSRKCEIEFLSRWRSINGTSVRTLSTDSNRRETQITNLVRKLSLPSPNSVSSIDVFLRANRLIF